MNKKNFPILGVVQNILIFISIIFLTLISSTPAAAVTGNGKIEGKVVNGTATGSTITGGLDITLKLYVKSAQTGSTTTKTDTEGNFVFDNLTTAIENSYIAVITYQNVEYSTDLISFTAGTTTQSVQLNVYDSTTSGADNIYLMLAHTVVTLDQGKLQFREYLFFVNNSDMTYLGSVKLTAEKKEVLKFSLPQGASQLQYLKGITASAVVITEQGFIDTSPFLPGEKQIVYSYEVPISKSYQYDYKVYYPLSRYDFLYQGGAGIQATAERLTIENSLDIDGTTFSDLYGEGYIAGDNLTIRLSVASGISGTTVILISLITALLLGVTGFILFRRRRQLEPVRKTTYGIREKLLFDIGQLDDDFEAGKIPEEKYNRIRAQKKAKLIRIIKSGKGED